MLKGDKCVATGEANGEPREKEGEAIGGQMDSFDQKLSVEGSSGKISGFGVQMHRRWRGKGTIKR